MYLECIVKKDTYPKVRYISMVAKEIDTNVSLMYLDVSWCILMYMNGSHQDACRIHSRYTKIHRIRILITNPPKFDNNPPVTRTARPRDDRIRGRVDSTAAGIGDRPRTEPTLNRK